jgi:hypothetical protein
LVVAVPKHATLGVTLRRHHTTVGPLFAEVASGRTVLPIAAYLIGHVGRYRASMVVVTAKGRASAVKHRTLRVLPKRRRHHRKA